MSSGSHLEKVWNGLQESEFYIYIKADFIRFGLYVLKRTKRFAFKEEKLINLNLGPQVFYRTYEKDELVTLFQKHFKISSKKERIVSKSDLKSS